MGLSKGKEAPNFEGVNQNGKTISLKDYAGQRVILYFYPKDMTPGCTIQAKNLSDNMQSLSNHGYVVIGVSADSVERHCKFIEKVGITFSLLADESKTIIKDYGVWGAKKFMGREFDGIKRTTFLIDENGFIQDVIDKVKTKSHTQQILDRVEANFR